MPDELEVHPVAAAWGLLPEPELRRLADDIAENGLRKPIEVLVGDGRIIGGQNRYAACKIAGVEPSTVEVDGDPMSLVDSENEYRRHFTTGQRAMARAMALVAADPGARKNGRWKTGVLRDENSAESQNSVTWMSLLTRAGLVIDFASELQIPVRSAKSDDEGRTWTLDRAYKVARERAEEAKQIDGLPDDLRTLVENRQVSLKDALRRAELPRVYAQRVSSGELSVEEAETLCESDRQRDKAELAAMKQTYQAMATALSTCTSYGGYDSLDKVMARFDEIEFDSPKLLEEFEVASLHQAARFIDLLIEWKEGRE